MFDLRGKSALVTGSAKGIGLEVVKALAECGAEVRATDLDEALLVRQVDALVDGGSKVSAAKLDVTAIEEWNEVVNQVRKDFGRLDILVNNAGVMHCGHFLDTPLDEFRRSMTINFESVVVGMQTAIPLMQESAKTSRAGGSIVNMSSIFGQVAGDSSAAYCASKGAVKMVTKAAALDLARMGANIRVNSVHPGAVNTDLAHGFQRNLVEQGALPGEEAGTEMVLSATPLARWGEVDDIGGVVAFLASDASKFMTGSEIVVDGGFTIT